MIRFTVRLSKPHLSHRRGTARRARFSRLTCNSLPIRIPFALSCPFFFPFSIRPFRFPVLIVLLFTDPFPFPFFIHLFIRFFSSGKSISRDEANVSLAVPFFERVEIKFFRESNSAIGSLRHFRRNRRLMRAVIIYQI